MTEPMRGRTEHFIHMDTCGYLPPEEIQKADDPKYMEMLEALKGKGVPVAMRALAREGGFNIDNLPPEMEIKANPTVTLDDLKSDMARIGAKQILATELNAAYEQAGVVSYFTPEMLSALAAKRLRAQQKAKKKLKKRK